MKKKKVHVGKSRQEKCILTVIAVLCALAVCVAGYGVWSIISSGSDKQNKDGDKRTEENGFLSENDPLAIRSIIIGDTEAQVKTSEKDEGTVYMIEVTLPVDFPFEKTTLNLELADGAGVSDESNCILADLGGRPVVNLTVENACLVIENGGEKREYRFLIELE